MREADIRRALGNLLFGLPETYWRILANIKKFPSRWEIARITLTWLLYCKRPLDLNELAIAVAIDCDWQIFQCREESAPRGMAWGEMQITHWNGSILSNGRGSLIFRCRVSHNGRCKRGRESFLHRQDICECWALELLSSGLSYLSLPETAGRTPKLAKKLGMDGSRGWWFSSSRVYWPSHTKVKIDAKLLYISRDQIPNNFRTGFNTGYSTLP